MEAKDDSASPNVLAQPLPLPSQGQDTEITAPPAFNNERLSLPFPARLPALATVSGISGMMLGLAHGGQEAGLRFRAEHAHRLPNSQAGWFLYHKSKNYHVMLGGIVEGVRMGGRIALWTAIFSGMEEGLDRGRAYVRRTWRNTFSSHRFNDDEELLAMNRDCASTTLAGIGTAGLFSAWNRFPIPTVVRMTKMGAKVGLIFGVAQDLVSLLRGRKLGYVEYVKRITQGRGSSTDEGKALAPSPR